MNNSYGPPIMAIVAMSENRVIGQNNRLPWHLPADLLHFKKLTTDKSIIMGRKTYESIGKPLPNRMNIVMTRDNHFQAEGCMVAHTIETAIKMAILEKSKEIFIIGGAELYKNTLSVIQRIYMTIVHHECDGDVYFPELNETEWEEKDRITHEKDNNNPYAYSFLILDRVKEK